LQLASNAWPLILGLQMPHIRKVMLQNFIFFLNFKIEIRYVIKIKVVNASHFILFDL